MPNDNVESQLGRRTREFKVAGAKNNANRFFGKAFSALGVLLLVAGAVCLARSSEIGWLWLGLGAMLSLGGAYALWEYYSDSTIRIDLHERGVSYQNAGKQQSICWEDVRAIHTSARRIRLRRSSKVNFDISHTVKLQGTKGGLEFSMNKNSMPKVGELVNLIEKAVTTQQLPEVAAKFGQGATVDFGAVTLSSQGIGHAGDFLTWERFHDIAFQNGTMIIQARSQQPGDPIEWAKVDRFHVANLVVLQMLVARARKAALALGS